jgi:predicted phosphodiesterase
VVDGLVPDTDQAIVLEVPPGPPVVLRVRTPADDLGPELARFATISDLHIGTDHFGFLGTLRERHAPEPHPIRCARAALVEAIDWGAERVVVKGDVVHTSRPHTWAAAAEVLGAVDVPVDIVLGNHDTNARSTVDPLVAAGRLGLAVHPDVATIDIDGLRLVLFDSTWPQVDLGRWNHRRAAVCDAVAGATGPAMLLVHHQPQPLPVPTYLPRGIPSPAAKRFVRAVTETGRPVIGASGHTHRHRRRRICGVTWVETGSPKDYPGTWTGYVVHAEGIRQVVRRVADPDCIRWTEYTRRTALGLWGRWAPGDLDARSFAHRWTA